MMTVMIARDETEVSGPVGDMERQASLGTYRLTRVGCDYAIFG